MSGLAVGVSLLIFLIVMMIATSSLNETVEEAGVGMLQQAEAIHRPYRAGLNEKGLIAYFSQPANRQAKFGEYWANRQADWFPKRVPGSREFATWDQLKDDRLWALVANQILTDETVRERLTDEEKLAILGEPYNELKTLDPDGNDKMREPSLPRRINEEAMERQKIHFTNLFRQHRLNASTDPFAKLRQNIHDETHTRLIHSPGGLRKKIFQEFQREFIADLDQLTGDENSQVKYVVLEVPDGTLPGFTKDELQVFSPSAASGDGQSVTGTDFSNAATIGDAQIDRNAFVDGAPAYGFQRKFGENESVKIYLDRAQIESRKTNLVLSILGISVVGIALAVMLAFLIGSSITKPLKTLMNDIQVISGGNFAHKPAARSNDEIGILARLLGDMSAGLKSAQAVWSENQLPR